MLFGEKKYKFLVFSLVEMIVYFELNSINWDRKDQVGCQRDGGKYKLLLE